MNFRQTIAANDGIPGGAIAPRFDSSLRAAARAPRPPGPRPTESPLDGGDRPTAASASSGSAASPWEKPRDGWRSQTGPALCRCEPPCREASRRKPIPLRETPVGTSPSRFGGWGGSCSWVGISRLWEELAAAFPAPTAKHVPSPSMRHAPAKSVPAPPLQAGNGAQVFFHPAPPVVRPSPARGLTTVG